MKRRLKNILMDYFMVNMGTLVAAAGIALFLVPAKVASGGVTGLGIQTLLFFSSVSPIHSGCDSKVHSKSSAAFR